ERPMALAAPVMLPMDTTAEKASSCLVSKYLRLMGSPFPSRLLPECEAIGKPVMLQGNVALIDVQDRRSILTIVRPIAWQWFVRDEGAPDGVDAGGENRIGDPLALGLGCGIHPFAEPDGADFGAMDGAAFVGKDGA